MSPAVGVVADDMTGALDAAVQFTRCGWSTLLDLRHTSATGGAPGPEQAAPLGGPPGAGQVVAVTSDCRALGESSAAVTQDAVAGLLARGVGRLYVKIDSAMRGSVRWQVPGALTAWSQRQPGAFAVVCPSYPAMGRTVSDGLALDRGVRLELGPAGRDPVTPVASSRLSDLLPGSVHVPAPVRGDAVRLADELARLGDRSAVLTVDARTDDDLGVLATALVRLGPRAVPVGSAGLAGAMAQRWAAVPDPAGRGPDAVGAAPAGPPSAPTAPVVGPVVVLVTSVHSASQQQVLHLLAHRGVTSWHLAPSAPDVVDDASLLAWLGRQRPPVASPDVVLVTAPPPDRRSRAAPAPEQVARRLAQVAEHARLRLGARAVVVVGGDGARELLDLWGAAGIAVRGAVAEGVPHGEVVGGTTHGLPVVTRSGGFGGVDALTVAVDHVARVPVPGCPAPVADAVGGPHRS